MNWDKYCDFIVVADVNPEIQKKRVMKRDNITENDFERINNLQMKNADKIKLADIVVDTNKKLNILKVDMINIIKGIEGAI